MDGRDDRREYTHETSDTSIISATYATYDTDFVDELLRTDGPHTRVRPIRRLQRGVGNLLVVLGALTGLLAVAYVVDFVASAGEVPRGVTVNGVAIGGLGKQEAEKVLRRELGPRVAEPIELRADETVVPLDPREAGLTVDWSATVERAGQQPWNPWTRVMSFFRDRETPLVTVVDEQATWAALSDLADRRINRSPLDGGIGFQAGSSDADEQDAQGAQGDQGDQGAVRPYAIEPRAGVRVSHLDTVVEAVRSRWPLLGRVDVPVESIEPRLTSRAVHTVLEETVRPLLAGPILLRGDGVESVLLPQDIRRAFEFEIRDGELHVALDHAVLRAAVSTELQSGEKPARNAALVFGVAGVFGDGDSGVLPSEPGRRIDWDRTFAGLTQAVTRPMEPGRREAPVVYDTVEPAVTTDDLQPRTTPN
ncbi:peptidoglycan binding domain-containing protein [Saccharomonospora sp.]|uniref:peptidoglycan binding domain-containing protein n=1 Tax=Saccharomonospora sp. TaxID=33913 RepID=UPI0026287690|nr:peptidoglycan binding domain-containing protein [Saccharomonospora sp.]